MPSFRANRQRSTLIGIGAGYAILIVCVAGPLYFMPEGAPAVHWGLIIPLLFVLFFFYVVTASLFKMFLTYRITPNGLLISKPPFYKRMIAYDDIKELIAVGEDQTKKLVEASMAEQNSYGESADLIGYIRMLRKRSPAFRYFTIAPRVALTTVGAREHATSMDVKSRGGMVVLRLKSGEEFFLTPQQPGAFSQAAREFMRKNKPQVEH